MDTTDIYFILLLLVLLIKMKKRQFFMWSVLLVLGYTAVKYLKPVEHLETPPANRLAHVMEGFVITDGMRSEARTALGRDATDNEILQNRLSSTNARISQLQSTGTPSTDQTLQGLIAERTDIQSQLSRSPTISPPPTSVSPPANRLAQVNADIAYLKSVGLTETSNNDTMKKLVAERSQLESTTSSPATALRDQPATPAAPLLPPSPAMKCSIENFGSI